MRYNIRQIIKTSLPYKYGKSTINNRNEFGRYCDSLGYKTAVEIGVDLGFFSEMLLQTSSLSKLYCIDPYTSYAEIPHERDTAKRMGADRLQRFHGRYEMVELPSTEAAKVVPSKLDFVYIDGAHDYANVLNDLNVWWPKVRIGGTLAGHDLDGEGVRKAVYQFATERRLTIHCVDACGDSNNRDENGGWAHPSFYFVK